MVDWVTEEDRPRMTADLRRAFSEKAALTRVINHQVHKDGFQVHFFGAEGEVQVDRGRFTFSRGSEMIAKFTGPGDKTSCAAEVQKAERAYLKDAKVKLYVSLSQTDDFLARVKDRAKPICNEQVGGHSAIVCHLMNQAYYHGKKMQWDPAKFAFTGGTGDPKWLTRDYRSPWKV